MPPKKSKKPISGDEDIQVTVQNIFAENMVG